MGVVYLATDPLLHRTVAIKVLPYAADEMRDRFAREARSAAALHHPNVVTIYDVGDAEGQPFIAMEYLEGETLAAVIERRAPLAFSHRLKLITDLCAGLGHAHDQGIIHRDIKPANLMVTSHGLKILDFGLARVTSTVHGTLTQAGSVLGTAHYMSPEQVDGRIVDRISEVFSVGLVMYELLAYAKAFPGDTSHVVMYDIVHREPRPVRDHVPDIDPHVEAVLGRAIDKKRARRYPDLNELAADLLRVRARLDRINEEATVFGTAVTFFTDPEATSLSSVELTGLPATPRGGIPNLDALTERRAAEIERHLNAALAHAEAGRYETAIGECEDAILLDPQEPRVLAVLMRAHAALEDRQVARWLDDARQHLTLGQIDAAEDLVTQALQIRTDSAGALALQRDLTNVRREREGAAARLQAIQDACARAQQQLAAGAFEDAVASASEALALQGGHFGARALKQKALAGIEEQRRQAAHELAAIDLVSQADQLALSDDYDAALALLAGFAPPHPLVDDAIDVVKRRQAAHEARRREEEERRLRAVEQEQRRARAAALRADARGALARQQFADALTALDRARQEWPGDPDLQQLAGEIDQAREAAAAAVRLRLTVARHVSDATQAFNAGDLEAASTAVATALALAPDNPDAVHVQSAIAGRRAEAAQEAAQQARATAAIAAARERVAAGALEDALHQLEGFERRDLVAATIEEIQIAILRRAEEQRLADERRLLEQHKQEDARRRDERRRLEDERRARAREEMEADRLAAFGAPPPTVMRGEPRPPSPRRPVRLRPEGAAPPPSPPTAETPSKIVLRPERTRRPLPTRADQTVAIDIDEVRAAQRTQRMTAADPPAASSVPAPPQPQPIDLDDLPLITQPPAPQRALDRGTGGGPPAAASVPSAAQRPPLSDLAAAGIGAAVVLVVMLVIWWLTSGP
jgi:serine/threonine-protein kinase